MGSRTVRSGIICATGPILTALPTGARCRSWGVCDDAILLRSYNVGPRVSQLVELGLDDLRLEHKGQVKLLGKEHKQQNHIGMEIMP